MLRICIIADTKSRVSAAGESGMSVRDAIRTLHKDLEDRTAWVKGILEKDDPWDFSLYDMVLPTDKMTNEEIGSLVAETMEKRYFHTFLSPRRKQFRILSWHPGSKPH